MAGSQRMATLAELYPDEQMVTDDDGMIDMPIYDNRSNNREDSSASEKSNDLR